MDRRLYWLAGWLLVCVMTQMYWFGPLLGGVMGAVLYDFLFAANSSIEKAKSLVSERDYDDSKFDQEGRRSSGVANSGLHLTEEPTAEQDYGTLH